MPGAKQKRNKFKNFQCKSCQLTKVEGNHPVLLGQVCFNHPMNSCKWKKTKETLNEELQVVAQVSQISKYTCCNSSVKASTHSLLSVKRYLKPILLPASKTGWTKYATTMKLVVKLIYINIENFYECTGVVHVSKNYSIFQIHEKVSPRSITSCIRQYTFRSSHLYFCSAPRALPFSTRFSEARGMLNKRPV